MTRGSEPAKESTAFPKVYGRYTVVRLLGEGGMGRVYLAKDPVLQRRVALKVILIDEHAEAGVREDYLKRFAVEARALAQLNHQSIVKVYDAGQERGIPWIAFEYVEGETLETLLQREIKLPLNRAVRIALDIGSALSHAHEKKIIHRDIKPANILIDQGTGIAKLTDFGVAKAPWAVLTQAGNALGSPGYMSPEQIEGYELDERSDFFSLGIVIYQMLSGNHPFMRDTVASTAFATVSGSYVPLRDIVEGIPPEIEQLVDHCLTPHKDKRISSAEFVERLRTFADVPRPPGSGVRLRTTAAGNLKGVSGYGQAVKFACRAFRIFWQLAWAVVRRSARSLRSRCHCIPRSKKVSPPGTPNIIAWSLRKTWRWLKQGKWKRLRPWLVLPVGPRRRRPSTVAAIAVALFLAALAIGGAVFLGITATRISYEDALTAGLNPEKHCSRWPPAKTAAACGILLKKNNVPLADSLASFLVQAHSHAPAGAVMKGRIAFRSGDYKNALMWFNTAAAKPDGKRLLRKECEEILAEFKPIVSRAKLPQQPVDILVGLVGAGNSRTVRSWTTAEQYWLRWNAVQILQAAQKPVDMVPVYLRDLELANSVKTRVNAAEQLGRLKDKRAIPYLRKIAARRWRDPFVAAAARDALKQINGR